MSNRLFSALSLLCLVAVLVPLAGHANDLMRLYQQATTQDQTLAAARHARDASVEARPQSWAAVLPQLSASGGIQRQEIKTSSGSRIIGNQVVGGGNYSTSWSWSLNLDETLFSFADFKSIAQSDVEVAAAENTLLDASQSLILRVAEAYFNVLAARDTVRADIAARDAFKAEMKEAKARFKVGLSTITDAQQAKASYDSARATLIGDRRALKNQRQALTLIVGHSLQQLQPLLPDVPLVPPSPANSGQWVQTAWQDNYELRGAQLQWDIAKREIGIQRAQRYPTINLQGSVGRSLVNHLPNSGRRSYVIGLVAKLPIFSGGLIRSQVRQASATAEQDRAKFQLQRRTTKQQVLDAYHGVISGIASVKAFNEAVNSNLTALKSTQKSFRVGTQTETDVLTALQNLYNALKSRDQSRYDYLDAVLTLKQRAGHLTLADLQRVDALLNTNPNSQQKSGFPPLPNTGGKAGSSQ